MSTYLFLFINDRRCEVPYSPGKKNIYFQKQLWILWQFLNFYCSRLCFKENHSWTSDIKVLYYIKHLINLCTVKKKEEAKSWENLHQWHKWNFPFWHASCKTAALNKRWKWYAAILYSSYDLLIWISTKL